MIALGLAFCNLIHMDLNIPVFSIILVLITFMFTCTQRNLAIHVPVYIINTSFLDSVYYSLFAQALMIFTVYNTIGCKLEM